MALNKRLLLFFILSNASIPVLAERVRIDDVDHTLISPTNASANINVSPPLSNYGKPSIVSRLESVTIPSRYQQILAVHAMDNQQGTKIRAQFDCSINAGGIVGYTKIRWKGADQSGTSGANAWTEWVDVTTSGPREFLLLLETPATAINPGRGDAECFFRIDSTKWGWSDIYKLTVTAETRPAAVSVSPTNISVQATGGGDWLTENITLTWEEFGYSHIKISSRDDMSVEFTSGRPQGDGKFQLGPANTLSVHGVHRGSAGNVGYLAHKKWVTMRFSGTTRQPKTYIVNFTHYVT